MTRKTVVRLLSMRGNRGRARLSAGVHDLRSSLDQHLPPAGPVAAQDGRRERHDAGLSR